MLKSIRDITVTLVCVLIGGCFLAVGLDLMAAHPYLTLTAGITALACWGTHLVAKKEGE